MIHELVFQFHTSTKKSVCLYIWEKCFFWILCCSNHRLCDNYLTDAGISHLLEALSGNHSLQQLYLMHTGLGDQSAQMLAERLGQHNMLKELNVAYNNIGDNAALTLVDACREHPSIHTVQWVEKYMFLFNSKKLKHTNKYIDRIDV